MINKSKKNFIGGINDTFHYISENKSFIFAWLSLYLIPALISLFVTQWTNTPSDFPLIIFNTVPRILSLMMLTFFGFLTKYEKTVFSAGLTVWSIWMLAISGMKAWIPVLIGIIGLLITGFMLFREKNERNKGFDYGRFRRFILFFYFIVALTFVIEILHRLDLAAPFLMLIYTPDIFMSNVQVILFTGSIVLICRRKNFSLAVLSFVWIALSFISLLKIKNVYEPVTLLDIFAIVDMSAVVLKYFKWFFFVLVAIVLGGIIWLLIYLAKKEKKRTVSSGTVVVVLTGILVLIASFVAQSNFSFMRFDSNKIIENYYKQGFASSLLRYTVRSAPERPEETEEINLESILAKIDENYKDKETEAGVQNVIVVQMESFCDVDLFTKYNSELEFEYDPIPFIHSLMNNYTSGNVSVPVFAGQTCKSEFEFLTGVNIDVLPGGYNPYVTSLNNSSADSLARYFKEKGYKASAVHNYQGEFFSRFEVYKNLGFDVFLPVECMNDCPRRQTDIWAGDSVLANEVKKILDSNKNGKNFVFNVSMQLHGSYPSLPDSEFPMEITGMPGNSDLRGKLGYYVWQLIEFDNAMKALVEMVEAREEPTVILFYADHLPQIARNLCDLSNEETFTTNYILWDNIGLEKTSKNCELYCLSTLLCDKIGATGGLMNKFNRLYTDKNAQSIMGYEMTFKNSDFTNDTYRIGISDPVIVAVEKTETSGKSAAYRLYGSNITENTVVTVNGKGYGINYVNEHELTFSMGNRQLSEGSELTLRVLGERLGTIFCESEKYIY